MRERRLRELPFKSWPDSDFGRNLSSLLVLGLHPNITYTPVLGDIAQWFKTWWQCWKQAVKNEKKLNTKEENKMIAFRGMYENHTQNRKKLSTWKNYHPIICTCKGICKWETVKSEWPCGNSGRLTHKNGPSRETEQSSIQRVDLIICYNFSLASLGLQDMLCGLRTELCRKHWLGGEVHLPRHKPRSWSKRKRLQGPLVSSYLILVVEGQSTNFAVIRICVLLGDVL